MTIWTAAREYSGIAEAGGVKNVVTSLAEALARLGHKVVCFLPFYGCVNPQSLGPESASGWYPGPFCYRPQM